MAEFVHVHGIDFPVEAIALAIDLEARGFEMVRTDEVLRFLGNQNLMTSEDRDAIRKYKRHLLEICNICTPIEN